MSGLCFSFFFLYFSFFGVQIVELLNCLVFQQNDKNCRIDYWPELDSLVQFDILLQIVEIITFHKVTSALSIENKTLFTLH